MWFVSTKEEHRLRELVVQHQNLQTAGNKASRRYPAEAQSVHQYDWPVIFHHLPKTERGAKSVRRLLSSVTYHSLRELYSRPEQARKAVSLALSLSVFVLGFFACWLEDNGRNDNNNDDHDNGRNDKDENDSSESNHDNDKPDLSAMSANERHGPPPYMQQQLPLHQQHQLHNQQHHPHHPNQRQIQNQSQQHYNFNHNAEHRPFPPNQFPYPTQQHQQPTIRQAYSRHWTGNMTRTIAHYERLEQIGEGTYGQVYRARCNDTGRMVALKKIRSSLGDSVGMSPTVIREIKILQRLKHPNLVEMIEVVSSKGYEHLDEHDEHREDKKHQQQKQHQKHRSKSSGGGGGDRASEAREAFKGNLFLVLEYVSHDLTGLMDVAYQFTEIQVKCIFKQLLEALEYMHEQKYVHRDIKSSNILIDSHFRVKLADFGLARSIEPPILDKLHG